MIRYRIYLNVVLKTISAACIAFLGLAESAMADERDSTRQELFSLISERKQLFDAYSESLDKKSGFFGNKTKKDLRNSQEMLVDIVAIDNRIMNALNRTLDYRNYEKQSMRYDAGEYEERIRSLKILNDTLFNKNAFYEQELKSLEASLRKHKLYNFFFLMILVIVGIGLFRRLSKKARRYKSE